MEIFDLGIAWNWEPDADFVKDLNDHALKEGLRPYLVHAYNFYSTLKDIVEDRISFRFFLDRASDDDPTFTGLIDFLKKKDIIFINHPDRAKKSTDKSIMHLEFINQSIPVPATIILNAQDDKQDLELKIKDISKPFILKPADGSSGEGVVLDAQSLENVLRLREQYGNITYIAQEKIYPKDLESRPAWFRIFYCFGKIIPCWWHPVTHIYDILTLKQIDALGLYDIWFITKKISQICKLDFFSTEIAMKNDKKFVVVDYVNDQCDMRKKSKFDDGVSDEVVDKVIKNIVSFVKQKQKGGEQR